MPKKENGFSAAQLEKYADVLIWGMKKARGKACRKNDIVLVRYNLPALRLAEILQGRLLDMGLNPVVRLLATAEMERTFFTKAGRRQLEFVPPGERELLENLGGSIFINAPESLTHLQAADPAAFARVALSRKPLRDILTSREENGLFGWTLCSYTTAQLARHARMTEKEYTRQIVRACHLDDPDPVARWEEIFRSALSIKRWLTKMPVTCYHVESPHIDLRIPRGRQRRWLGVSGHNMPSFELFTSPDWRGVEGVYYADQPSFRQGNYVTGVRLEFRKGSVVNVEAKKGAAFTTRQVAMDPGAKRLGEFSLTDVRFSRIDRFMADTLFDENFGGRHGNCHVALGASYSDTFDGNPAALTKARKKALGFNDSALHWDLVNTEPKTVTAHLTDGRRRIIYENGRFTC